MMQWDKLMRQPLCRPCQLETLLPYLIGGGLGALAGLGGGGDINQTVTTTPPMPNAQQQIMINQLANWLYQNYPTYQNYINQTLSSIYGGAAGAPTVGGVTADKIPGQLSGELATKHEANVSLRAQQERDIQDWENAKKIYDQIEQTVGFAKRIAANRGMDWKELLREFNLSDAELKTFEKHGISSIEAKDYLMQYANDPEGFKADFLGEKPMSEAEIQKAMTDMRLGPLTTDQQQALNLGYTMDDLKRAAVTGTPVSDLIAGRTPSDAWSPFQEIMSWDDEKISEYYSLEKQKQQREIQDWYNQATREYEQRGISQSGGYLGSRQETDLSRLLGEKGRLESTLSTALGQAELAQQQKQPYQMLEAAQSLLGTMQNLQTPWLQLGQGLTTPYGATTQTSVMPGASSAQGALAGGLTGLGLYGMGQGLGWWGSNQPATSFGWGMAGQTPAQAYATSPLANTGLQGLWQSYIPTAW